MHNDEATMDNTVQLDYVVPMREGHVLSVGAKAMMRKADAQASNEYFDGTDFQTLASSDVDYVYRNHIAAAYAEYDAHIGSFGVKGGLRYEHTWQDVEYANGRGTDFTKKYGNWVPSASLQYSFSPTQNVGLTYGLSLSRPGISYLNPYVNTSDPTVMTYGNTDVEVVQTHNVGLVYNFFSQKFMGNVNVSHSWSDNGIEAYEFYDDGLLNRTYGNIVSRKQTSATLYVNWLAHKNTRIFSNAGVSHLAYNSSLINVDREGWQGNMMLGLQQTLPKSMNLGVYLFLETKRILMQGSQDGHRFLGVNLSKNFFNDKFGVSLNAQTSIDKHGRLYEGKHTSGADFKTDNMMRIRVADVGLRMTYNFGNKNINVKQRTSRINNDYDDKKQGSNISTGMQQ